MRHASMNLSGPELREHLRRLFLENNVKEFVTLSYNGSFNFEGAFSSMDKFFNCILQGVHGGHWKRRIKRDQKFIVIGIFEYDGENVHLHAGVAGEPAELKFLRVHGDDVWKEKHPHGDCLSTNIHAVLNVAYYSTKTVCNKDDQEQLYTYVFPEPPEVDHAVQKRSMTTEQRRAQIFKNKQERSISLHGKISDTKKNRAKAARYAKAKGR
jgi:hypothetical protein